MSARYNNLQASAPGLMEKVVAFLNFKASSHSGHDTNDLPNIQQLSGSLQRDIRVALYKPGIKEVRLFGLASSDEADKVKMERLFSDIDRDNSGTLCGEEINQLLTKLGLEIPQEDFKAAMLAMDRSLQDERVRCSTKR